MAILEHHVFPYMRVGEAPKGVSSPPRVAFPLPMEAGGPPAPAPQAAPSPTETPPVDWSTKTAREIRVELERLGSPASASASKAKLLSMLDGLSDRSV